jgi:hypothetical protein
VKFQIQSQSFIEILSLDDYLYFSDYKIVSLHEFEVIDLLNTFRTLLSLCSTLLPPVSGSVEGIVIVIGGLKSRGLTNTPVVCAKKDFSCRNPDYL